MIKIIRNEDAPISKKVVFVLYIRIGVGIRSTISISNTRKIIAKRKNRIENGIRAKWLGSNPHSNGDIFSRWRFIRSDRNIAKMNRITGMAIAVKEEIRRYVID